MMGIEFVTDKKTRTPFDADSNIGVLIAQQAQARGLIVRPLGSMVVLSPCLTLEGVVKSRLAPPGCVA